MKEPSKHLSYSTKTLILVVALLCVGLGFYVLVLSTRLAEANRELTVRRQETGTLDISDRSRVNIVEVSTDEPNTWQWRMFVPKGHRYSWNLAAEEIPQHEVPAIAGTMGVSNEPYSERDNEVFVTAKLRQLEQGDWALSVDSKIGDSKEQMGGASLRIPAERIKWMTEVSSTDGQVAGSRGTDARPTKGPIILLQRRPCKKQPDGSYRPSPNPMPGFMIWLREE